MATDTKNLTSTSLSTRDQQAVWHPFTPLSESDQIIALQAAEGVYLHTTDGRKILDAVSSWWVNLHGHSHPHIAEAIYQQACTLEHVIFAGFTHEPAVRLAERLLDLLPGNMRRIFYSDNGSTAVEVALKMAFQYWHNQGISRKKVIALDGAYHGDTFGAMSVGERSAFTAPFAPYLFDVEFVPFPSRENTHSLVSSFTTIVQSGEVAAFIYEPLVQGAAGMRMYEPEILEKLLQIANAHQVICIADEVMTGFGRTGKLFASAYCTTPPDIMCLSKGLTGGSMALGVTACSADILRAYQTDDRLKTFFHGHSFTANPIACAAANASLDLLLVKDCQQAIERIAGQHQQFRQQVQTHPAVRDVRCQGTILAVELRTDSQTSYFNQARNQLYQYFLDKNLLLRPLGNVIYVLPPYVMTDEELGTVYAAITDVLNLYA